MSLSYFPGHALRTQSPQADFPQAFQPVQRTAPEAVVGGMPYSSLRREARIRELTQFIEDYMWLAETLKPVNLPEAERWRDKAHATRRERDAMALSRTPEEVALLERARGLS